MIQISAFVHDRVILLTIAMKVYFLSVLTWPLALLLLYYILQVQ